MTGEDDKIEESCRACAGFITRHTCEPVNHGPTEEDAMPGKGEWRGEYYWSDTFGYWRIRADGRVVAEVYAKDDAKQIIADHNAAAQRDGYRELVLHTLAHAISKVADAALIGQGPYTPQQFHEFTLSAIDKIAAQRDELRAALEKMAKGSNRFKESRTALHYQGLARAALSSLNQPQVKEQ